ncbi:AAA family ATPase [Paenibacillus hamazuiensis]|uniref:AAA family ATPase n=1 Tax=Paenibacillus hamazuiensis TaxID=2936508 RepID=UPI00200F06DE|nr:AAA family ATPase [Paenibacillus hamazuiensis]
MTTDWSELIRRCGLSLIRKHRMNDRFELYETTHRWESMVLGKYLLIPLGFESFMELSESSETFQQFEEEIIAPFYFRLKGDWGWNLYICFVLEESHFMQIPSERMARVERGKRYGKKLVMSIRDIVKRLPAAKVPDMHGQIASDPLEEWRQALAPLSLEFCLDNFSKTALQAYIDASPPPAAPRSGFGRETEDEIQERPMGPIQSLQFGNRFRPHFLAQAPTLEFARVNLLTGPNGMGKTSVLECIELAFTGSVQRNALTDRQIIEDWNGWLAFHSGQAPFQGIPSSQEKKRREIAYYKHKVAPMARSQLNRAFHQYNYFSSEAVYQFCYNPDSRIDYRTAFARVIYGEELERTEQCWTRYLQEFKMSSNRYKEELDKLDSRLAEVQRQGLHESDLIKGRAEDSLSQLKKWMTHCYLAYPHLSENATLEEMEQWLQRLQPLLHEIDIIRRPLSSDARLAGINNLKQLKEELRSVQAAQEALMKSISDIQTALRPDSGTAEPDTLAWNRFEELKTSRDRLRHVSEQLAGAAELLDQSASREERKRIASQLQQLNQYRASLMDFTLPYGSLTDVRITMANVGEAEVKLAAAAELAQEAARQHDEAVQRVKAQKNRSTLLQKLASEIKSYGRRFLHEQPGESRCPMCGHSHESSEHLLKAVNTGLKADDEFLTTLLAEEEKCKSRLQARQEELTQARLEHEALTKLNEALSKLLTRGDMEEIQSLSEKSGGSDVQSVLRNMAERLQRIERELAELQMRAEAWDKRGFTLAAIHRVEALLASPALADITAKTDSGLTGSELLKQLEQAAQRLDEETERARGEYDYFRDLRSRLAGLERQRQELASKEKSLEEAERTWHRLREHNVRLLERYSWQDWFASFQKLQLEAERLRDILAPRLLLEQKEREAAELNAQRQTAFARWQRSCQAAEALSGLKNLSEYGDDFVKSNFEAISSLFVALHAPNEFEYLSWTDDNKIAAKRKGSPALCGIHEMSTGQRTSVILALFFVMHLVMDSAPKFLLLDEPVANMDELNVLGLLDFLRQLTITHGTQLFFTTANPQVATLFRRKFSFLQEHFRTFHLQRSPDGPVQIHVQSFIPSQERALEAYRLQ